MKQVSFLEELLENGNISKHVEAISLKKNPERRFYRSDNTMVGTNDPIVYADVPGYLNITFSNIGSLRSEKSVATFEGSYIDLKKYDGLDHFLKSKLSSKRVSRLRAYKKTLENVFPIDYQYHYGEIGDDTYELIMDTLKGMITNRFEEKGMQHMALLEWDRFRALGKGLIRSKRASLIVIQHGDSPIHISFNYIWKELVFGYVRGFDTDYSKFYLGYIDIMIQLEWCFDKGFEIYDLLRENMSYKLRFADHTYLYADHVVFANKGWFSKLGPIAKWLSLSSKFDIYYPTMSKLRHLYHMVLFLPKRKQREVRPNYQLERLTQAQWEDMDRDRLKCIELDSLDRKGAKRAIYHFLYLSKEKLNDLKLYLDLSNKSTIVLECPKNKGKVSFTNQGKYNGQ